MTLNYYIEREIAILQLKYKVDILINEAKFCGKIHSNKDLNHTAIFTKVTRRKQKKMRNINGWLWIIIVDYALSETHCHYSFLKKAVCRRIRQNWGPVGLLTMPVSGMTRFLKEHGVKTGPIYISDKFNLNNFFKKEEMFVTIYSS